jgi:hypothetical protein
MTFCQFCNNPATALVERILDGKPLPVCEECWRLASLYPIYKTNPLWGRTDLKTVGGIREKP